VTFDIPIVWVTVAAGLGTLGVVTPWLLAPRVINPRQNTCRERVACSFFIFESFGKKTIVSKNYDHRLLHKKEFY
jgi:hypothetical protein